MRRATNALVVENDEAHMSPTAMLESDIKHICADMAEVKSDIRNLRDRMDGIHDTLLQKIDAGHAALLAKIDAGDAALLAKIDANHTAANGRFDDVRDKIDANQAETDAKLNALRDKIDANQAETNDGFEKTNASIAALEVSIESSKVWLFGVLLLIAGGLLTAMAKGFHWI